MDVASRKGQDGFITCAQLSDVINSVNLNISPKEVEVLAYGRILEMSYIVCDH